MPNLAVGNGGQNQNDAWSPITTGGGQAGGMTSNNEVASIDPFSPVAQKELSEFYLLRNEIESTNTMSSTTAAPGGNNGLIFVNYVYGAYLGFNMIKVEIAY